MSLPLPSLPFPLPPGPFDRFGFTAAETIVAGFVLAGFCNKDIAQRLGKAEATVKNQIAGLLHKSGAQNRTHFVAGVYRELLAQAKQGEQWSPARAESVSSS